jgi:hypothetical protein
VYLLIEFKELVYVFDSIYLCQHIFVVDPEVNPLYSLAHYGSEEREQRERKILAELGFTQALP